MKQRLGTRRLMGLITGEYSHITVAGKKMTADNFNAEGKSVFYYDGKRCTSGTCNLFIVKYFAAFLHKLASKKPLF